MQKILDFLNALRLNNNREWFMAHKADYLEAQARFNDFALSLFQAIASYDPSVKGLGLNEMTYRIYRDVRFSKDKSPYKTHFGVYVCRGGKKSNYSGYYFHIAAEGTDTFGLNGHCLAAGDYCCPANLLKVLREDIAYGNGAFERILKGAPKFKLDESQKLCRVPHGFEPELSCADLLRYKVYCLLQPVPTSFVLKPNLAERVADAFRPTKPFLDFINRAVDYLKEETPL